MLLNVASVFFIVLLTNVLGQKSTTFPAPKDNTANPHSRCRKWRDDFKKSNGVSAHRLTSLETSALVAKTAEVNSQNDIEPANRSKRISGSSGFTGACGVTYSGQDRMVCLWNGSFGKDDPNYVSGWLTGELKGLNNCFKTVTVTANGRTVDATIADGCAFSTGKPVDIDHGCSDIYLSDQVMSDLGFTDNDQDVRITSWDFKTEVPANQPW
ncbi:uncharacterized protein MELLADRAFT_73750 [Melampsora larici-populina 98AG31]|uniref:Secreted protein n=1 Tax=Melampsora larici-populina (strain 98AG31 / pathotype 3-4-7) TaxID=747676 RepID=F4RAD5_MELLP|nr:uncharacterized protein MELLADRAFT_70965 [Melampsora larici-populina 98AG31]XP_007419632.1 uncharacterized protein MELLADRAFT_73750 [Melampsora larici-populina 98AG31]EGF97097.1 secreted protein [Melampsora larici-populina 98AG31]EGG10802.1 secreted protein [Melampsora larici-populina 98AG31]